jgi:hypothetical protein
MKSPYCAAEIGDLVTKHLKELDRVAYIRFASVYKQFEEPKDFQKLCKEVEKWSQISRKMEKCRLSKGRRMVHLGTHNIGKLWAHGGEQAY